MTPGLGSVTALAVLVPVTYYMSPLPAIAFLVGVNKGGTSGGAVPAILLNAPGTPEAAASALDGYPMARRGEAERAMKFALFSSVTGDTISDLLLIVLVVPFAAIALEFGPLEYTAVLLFAFSLLAGISGGSTLKGLIAIFLGVFLSTIGLDPIDSTSRMTFDEVNLYDGLPLAALALGSLALASVVEQIFDLRRGPPAPAREDAASARLRSGLPASEFFGHWKAIVRSAPDRLRCRHASGAGGDAGGVPELRRRAARIEIARLVRQGEPRGNHRHRGGEQRRGRGQPGAHHRARHPPGNIAAALLIGAFIIHGIVPGPFMLTMHGDLVYALFASMLMANFVHLVIGRVGIPIWGWIARVPKSLVLPPVVVMCVVGVYLPGQSLFDIGVMLAFAGVGLVMNRSGFPVVCLVIGFLLGGMLESSLRQSMLLYKSDFGVLLESPIAIVFLVLTLVVLGRAARRG